MQTLECSSKYLVQMDTFSGIVFIFFFNYFFFPKKQNARKYITLGIKYINSVPTKVDMVKNLLKNTQI